MNRRSFLRIAMLSAALTAAAASALASLRYEPGLWSWAASAACAASAALLASRGHRDGCGASTHRQASAAALVFSSVRLAGGFGGPLTPLYFLLLAWMAGRPVRGPALETGIALGLLEGLLTAFAGGLITPDLLDRLSAAAVPLVALPVSSLALEWMASGGLRSRGAGSRPVLSNTGGGDPAPVSQGCLDLVKSVAQAGSLGGAIHATAAWLAGSGNDLTVTVGLLSTDSGSLDVYESLGPMAQGRVGMTFDLEGSVAGWTINSGNSVSRCGLGSGGRTVTTLSRSDPSTVRCGSCSAAPVVISGKSVGVLLVESPSEEGTGPGVEGTLDMAAGLLGLAIEKILLREQKKDLQNRDGLTGLPHPVDFMDFVRRTSRDVYRFGRSVSLFVVEVDSLEEVNAAHGYRGGNRLLSACGESLGGMAGSEAALTRLSASKFAICIPGMDQAAAEAFAESVVRSFDCMKVKLESGEASPRVVVGGAVTRSDRRIESLCTEAARAMVSARTLPARFQVAILLASSQNHGAVDP